MSHVERFAMSTVLISHMMTVKQKKKKEKENERGIIFDYQFSHNPMVFSY